MDKCVIQCVGSVSFKGKKFQTQGDLGTQTPISPPGEPPGSQKAWSPPPTLRCAEEAFIGWGSCGGEQEARPLPAFPEGRAVGATDPGLERWGLTFALPALPLVAWLAEAFVGLGRVLADGIDVAVIRALGALVHVGGPCGVAGGGQW